MWHHLSELIQAATTNSNSGGSSTTLLGVVGSGVFGVLIVAVDRWLSKRRPRADAELRNQTRLDKEWNDLFDKVNDQFKECQKESGKLRAENLDLKIRIVACETQIEKLQAQIDERPPHA